MFHDKIQDPYISNSLHLDPFKSTQTYSEPGVYNPYYGKQSQSYTKNQSFIIASKDAKRRGTVNKIEHTFIIKLFENLEEKVTSSTY